MGPDSEDARYADDDTLRHQLEHEDGLMVNRLSWLVASQSFLFTAFAITLNGSPPAQSVAALRHAELLRILPVLGLTTCGLIYLSLLAGGRVTMALRRVLAGNQREAVGLRPPLQGTRTTHAVGLAAPLLLPPVFLIAWMVLLLGRQAV